MAEHLDLEGMSHRDAQEYVRHYLAALKEVQRKRARLKEEFEKWERRARLAKEKGREDLEKEALSQCKALVSQYETLGEEERRLDTDVLVLKKNLGRLQRQPDRTIDAEALLHQLQGVVGEDNETNQHFSELEADQELAELKRKLGDEEGSGE